MAKKYKFKKRYKTIKHKVEIIALCPVNGERDSYKTTIYTNRVIYVEEILTVAQKYENKRISQEELTYKLARKLGAEVKTVGYHSGVKTIVSTK